ncbi:MAG: cell wall-active antibiotics response protein [Bacteroidota bacterium]|jgi:predicted membrane protein|nr:cell wall-active antibiotics response protein [Bacteroidota bacterium]
MHSTNHRSNNRAFTGIILIIGGLLLLAYKMGYPIPGWIFSWPMLLIVIGILVGIKNRFQNFGWFIMIAIGSFFLIDQELASASFHQYFWPAFLILAGIIFILKPKKSTSVCVKRFKQEREVYNNINNTPSGITSEEDYLSINSIFSGIQRTVISKNFSGGKINCVFGGVEIDCTQADIITPACLQIEAVFGGVKLIIPKNWSITNELDGVFHGVDDKRNQNTLPIDTPNKVLILKGSAVFAGVEIRSY